MIIKQTGTDFLQQKKTAVLTSNPIVRKMVSEILTTVAQEGDRALFQYTEKFDQVSLEQLKVPLSALQEALCATDQEILGVLEEATENIRKFHTKEVAQSWQDTDEDGTILGQIVRPLDRVGIYIPGGRAVYPSTLLMNVIPAQIANVPSIVVVSPPGREGLPHPLVMATCALLKVDEVYAIGGAQSIGALAYGTETITPVCKITGPGNQYVAEAKRQVFGIVGIDSVAGPSEILILHDDLEIPIELLVRDLISQAEHDPEAQSILVTTHDKTANQVIQRLEELVPQLPRNEIITTSLKNRGKVIVVKDLKQGVEITNKIAPEHLEILCRDVSILDQVRNAGAIFIGKWSPEPVGDYYAGPNHTIPTGGTARFSSPLNVRDFQKHSSLVEYSQKRFEKHAKQIAQFAELEELFAHAAAIQVRHKSL